MLRVKSVTACFVLILFFFAIPPAPQVSAASIEIKGGLNFSKVTGGIRLSGTAGLIFPLNKY